MGDPKTFRIAAPPLARPLARSFPFSLHLSSKVPSPHACMGQRECTDLDTAADDPVAVHSEFRLREISSFGIPPKKLRAPTCGGRLELSQSVSQSVSRAFSASPGEKLIYCIKGEMWKLAAAAGANLNVSGEMDGRPDFLTP